MASAEPPASNSKAAKPVVCFLGPVSSYTHQATLGAFPPEKYELMPVVTIKDIFDTTQSGQADYGVVPFENSTNGSVVFTLDHLADRHGAYADLSVCAEVYLDVHHCLVGHIAPTTTTTSATSDGDNVSAAATTTSANIPTSASSSSLLASGQCTPTPRHPNPEAPRSRPEHPLTHVRRVYSHPQAFGQCTRFLNAYLRGVETVDVSSTSRAAEMVAKGAGGDGGDGGGGKGAAAAISSLLAAELQGLDVLARDIEDRDDNTTRFFVVRRGADEEGRRVPFTSSSSSSPLPPPPPPSTSTEAGTGGGRTDDSQSCCYYKTLVSFTVPHRSPGALADVLECFRRRGLNLTSMHSRPSLVEAFQYVFFVEVEGHRYVGSQAAMVREALGEVEKGPAERCRWWGSFVDVRR